MTALQLAMLFHETYERLAPSFGYETRTETRTFDPESKNGKLMVAVCGEILHRASERIMLPVRAAGSTTPSYAIDWKRVQTVDDVKAILQAIGPEFEADCPTLHLVEHLTEKAASGMEILARNAPTIAEALKANNDLAGLREYLDRLVIDQHNIGEIRRHLFHAEDCWWNTAVREETAKREVRRG